MAAGVHQRGVRLAELVASLSLAIDLGLGQPMEHVQRSTRIALALADELGLTEEERSCVYYSGLLFWVGCHGTSFETAPWFGDDIVQRARAYEFDKAGVPMLRFLLGSVGAGRAPLERARALAGLAVSGRELIGSIEPAHCELAVTFARRLGLGEAVAGSLDEVYERWDGRGSPNGLGGGRIALSSRLLNLAFVVEVIARAGGTEAAVEVARKRSGTHFDPDLVDLFTRQADQLFAGLAATPGWDAMIDAEPGLAPVLNETGLEAALEALADFADIKSPYTLGHSRGVSALAARAAEQLGLAPTEVTELRHAGLVHDIGRLGISNTIWDKPGDLTTAERERVRLLPYLSERVLACSPRLAPLGELAAQHHERLDGSGYPRGVTGNALDIRARILAAADVYQALTEPRPHRPALPPDAAAAELRGEVKSSRLDGEAATAVLGAAGHRVRTRREFPHGLTRREAEVLTLVARGMTSKQIAERLYIAPKTVSNHVEHIYTKIEVSSRAAASLFAMQHGLVGSLDPTNEANSP